MPTVLLSPSSKSDVVEAVSSVSSAFRAVTLYFALPSSAPRIYIYGL